mgnify:CR=1 FL=1
MVEMAPVVMQRSASQVSLLSDAEADAAETRDAQGETRQHGDAHARADDERNESDDSSETRKRKWYAVALLTLTSAFLYADQNLLSPNLSAVAEEFGLSDEEKDVYLGGYLQLAFFCVGAPASLVIGWLADKMNRVRLLAIVVAIGEGPCLGTYFVKTYWELFAVRSLTGIAVGGCLPLLFSICGDLFPSHERAYVATFLTVATGAGIAGGQIMAGTVGPAYGWRLPFVLSAAPAILLALVTYTTVKEPERGGMEHAVMQEKERKRRGGLGGVGLASSNASEDVDFESRPAGVTDNPTGGVNPTSGVNSTYGTTDTNQASNLRKRTSRIRNDTPDETALYTAKIDTKKLKRQLQVPSNLLILAQGLPGTIPWGMLNAYFVDYLHVQKGLSVEEGTLAVTLFGIGAVVGTICGGIYGQKVYNRADGGGKKSVAVLMGTTTALGSLPLLFAINVNSYGPGEVYLYLVCLLGGILCAITPPNVRAVLLNVNPPETRGTIFAFYSQVDDVGKGGGPAVVAGLIVLYGRAVAFNIAVSGWLVCGGILLLLVRYIDQDVEKAHRAVAEEVESGRRREESGRVYDGNDEML